MKFLFLVASVGFASLAYAGDEKAYDREAVRQTIRKSITSFKNCYDEGVKKNPSLEGKVVVEWDIGTEGSVKTAAIKSSTLNDDAVHKCMIDNIMVLKFPAPLDGMTANIVYPFVFAKVKK